MLTKTERVIKNRKSRNTGNFGQKTESKDKENEGYVVPVSYKTSTVSLIFMSVIANRNLRRKKGSLPFEKCIFVSINLFVLPTVQFL